MLLPVLDHATSYIECWCIWWYSAQWFDTSCFKLLMCFNGQECTSWFLAVFQYWRSSRDLCRNEVQLPFIEDDCCLVGAGAVIVDRNLVK